MAHNQDIDTTEPLRKVSVHIYILPNLMTTANMFFGFFSIILAMKGQFQMAAYAIVASAVFDLLDGRLARLTRSTSKFGAEYDSLSDVLSFGMAPALLMYLWALEPFGRLGWLASFVYLACTALRLARFNVQAHVVEKNYFQGLPSPMAAGIVASAVLAFMDLGYESRGNIGLLLLTVLLGIVMVSTFRYRSFKDLDLKERVPFKYLVFGVGVIAWIAYRPEVHLFVLFLIYALLGAVLGVLNFRKNKKFKSNVYMPSAVNSDPDLIEDEDEAPSEEHKK